MLDFLSDLESCFHASAPFYHAFMNMHISFMLSCCLFNMFLFVCFQFCLFFFWYKKKLKNQKATKIVCVLLYFGTCVPWMAIETKSSKLYIICSLNEHLYAQLSKWVLWLVFVMSTIKIVSYILYLYRSFWWEGLENPKRKA